MNYNSIKKIEKLYDDRISSTNDSVKAAGQWGSNEFVPLICKEICSKINLERHYTVLELGCGSGVLGNYISERCMKYVGIDLSFQMMKHFLHESKTNVSLIQTTTDNVPLPDNSFDIVLLNGVTMYFHDDLLLKKTLEEMKRLVTSDGTIFIGENIIPKGYFWEFVWFQNLSNTSQMILLPYVKIRKFLAKNRKLAGKWASIHKEIAPKFIKQFFKESDVIQSRASAYTIKHKILGKKYRGNRRADFVIKLK